MCGCTDFHGHVTAQVASYAADKVVSTAEYAVDKAGKLVESAANVAEGLVDMASALADGEPYVVHSEQVWSTEQSCRCIVHRCDRTKDECGPTNLW